MNRLNLYFMTIDQSQPDSLSLPRFIKPSHRTRPEQLVGFGIFLLICLAFEMVDGKLVQASLEGSWFDALVQAPWAISMKTSAPYWTLYFLTLSVSAWTLWRRVSLRVLKLEMSIFSAQFLFQLAWSVSFFLLQETLLALVALLLLWSCHLLCALLFWKKEKTAGILLTLPFLWIFYMMCVNMAICASNP